MSHSQKYKRLAHKLGIKGEAKPGALISRMHSLKGMPKKKHMKLGEPSFKHYKERKPKPQGKGIVKALGQKGTTGNFAKIEKAEGKGAAIGALQNKLAARRGKPAPFHRKHHKEDEPSFKHHKEVDFKCKKHQKTHCKEC